MTVRKAMATTCLIAALACGVPPVAAQSQRGEADAIAATPGGAMADEANSARDPGLGALVTSAQAEPAILALFGVAAIALGLYLRRYFTK
jgi:hypothetical protein